MNDFNLAEFIVFLSYFMPQERKEMICGRSSKVKVDQSFGKANFRHFFEIDMCAKINTDVCVFAPRSFSLDM